MSLPLMVSQMTAMGSPFSLLLLWLVPLLGGAILFSPVGADLSSEYKPNAWYRNYDTYPEYCSTPEAMFDRKIPPLQDYALDRSLGETRLLHVTAVIRHGARTPWSANEQCWDGYWNATQDTSVWDCDLTTVLAPPDPNMILFEEDEFNDWLPDDAFFMFEQRFDALTGNGGDIGALSNELNGTCKKGQLLMQGYEQHIQNGRILRHAYAYRSNDYSHEERMRLINLSPTTDTGSTTQPWSSRFLHYRADDDQRTLMSGQVLLRGLFDEEVMDQFLETGRYPHIPVHTADRAQDVLDANEHVCPRLKDLRQAALQSGAFQTFNTSDQLESLRWFASEKLGNTNTAESTRLLDCLMTTICTDRTLPDALNDFGNNSAGADNMFEAFAQADIQSYNLVMKYNDAAHAKLSMGPLWAEIMENINPWLEQFDYSTDIPAPKFALFSGHDTTLMPLLASLHPDLWKDTEWAPYASMMVIEIHELIDGISDREIYTTDFAFRLLFNGKILTHLVPGCREEGRDLCDIVHFKAAVDPIAIRDADCTSQWDKPTIPNETIVQATQLMTTTEGILMFVGLVVFGILVGAVMTFVLLTGRLPCVNTQVLESTVMDDDDYDEDECQGFQSSSYFEDEPRSGEDAFVNDQDHSSYQSTGLT